MDTENELFKGAAILAMNRRFPSTDKITIFENKDLASDVVMASMSLKPYKEYVSTRSGSKIASAYVNDRPCLLRYVDLNPNVDSQGDTLVYLSLLKTFTHSQLEQMNTVGVIELGTGKNKETKIIIISDVGQEVAPLLSHLEEKPISQSDWYKRIKLSLDIARGLEHLHRHGIVHGDINSGNILVSQRGVWEARLSGFFRCCQRGYQSGQLFFEFSDDIFCLGLLMAEMALGDGLRQAFNVSSDGLSDAQIRKLVQTKRIAVVETKLRKLIPFQCPESFEALICECCNSDAAKRPRIDTCIDALSEVLEDMGSPEEPVSLGLSQPKSSAALTSTSSVAPIVANKRGSIDPTKGTMTFYPRQRQEPEQQLNDQIQSLEMQLQELKNQAQATAQVQAQQQAQQPAEPVPGGAPSQADVMLAAILQKLDTFETRLNEHQDLIAHKSFPAMAPEPEPEPDSSEPADVKEVQNQLDKFTFYVDQAKAAKQALEETVVAKKISPQKSNELLASGDELSGLLHSFESVIEKCNAVSMRTSEVLGSVNSGGSLLGLRESSEGGAADAFRSPTSPGATSRSAVSPSGRSPQNNNPGNYSFSKTPRFGNIRDQSVGGVARPQIGIGLDSANGGGGGRGGGGGGGSVNSGGSSGDSGRPKLTPGQLLVKTPTPSSAAKRRTSPMHPSLQHNPGSTFAKSMGEGIGISPGSLPKGFWKDRGSTYKAGGWMLRPSNDSRLGPRNKSVGSPGTPHICMADSKLLHEFYRADPAFLNEQRKAEVRKGTYNKDVPYRHQKTGGFFESCSGPENAPQPPRKAMSLAQTMSGKSYAAAPPPAPAARKPESLASLLRHQN